MGVSAVLAKSFARIFYRNAINIGLLLIECDTDGIDAGDELEVDLKAGVVKNIIKNTEITFSPLPDVMIKFLLDGGLIKFGFCIKLLCKLTPYVLKGGIATFSVFISPVILVDCFKFLKKHFQGFKRKR